MSIRNAVTAISPENAKRYAEAYFAPDPRFPGVGIFTGSHFESLGADQNLPNQITASDLLAVGTLSVNVPARANIALLGELSEEISGLLAQIPADIRMGELRDEPSFNDHLGVQKAPPVVSRIGAADAHSIRNVRHDAGAIIEGHISEEASIHSREVVQRRFMDQLAHFSPSLRNALDHRVFVDDVAIASAK